MTEAEIDKLKKTLDQSEMIMIGPYSGVSRFIVAIKDDVLVFDNGNTLALSSCEMTDFAMVIRCSAG